MTVINYKTLIEIVIDSKRIIKQDKALPYRIIQLINTKEMTELGKKIIIL